MRPPFFLGIDIGTQGARVVLLDVEGHQLAAQEEDFPLNNQSREEQSPSVWWHACLSCLQRLIAEVRLRINTDDIKAVAVTSTSGTVIPLGADNEPLYNAIMYSDKRSAEEGERCRGVATRYTDSGFTGFNSSSGLSKMLWFVNRFPLQVQNISRWIHASDFITGKLSGRWGITDYTNALKSGFDLQNHCWPEYLFKQLPLHKDWLPMVVAPGTPIGTLSPALAVNLGLNTNIQVVAGMTDGCASQIASGAVKLGDWNTTIGTTLVVKGVTNKEIKDPEGTLYSHRHPDGYWMPGGAANIGADWISMEYKDDLAALNEKAAGLIPTGKMVYPLRQEGERFPFTAPQARGFQQQGLSREETFAAAMEGVAYVERYAYEMIEKLAGEGVHAVYSAGGGSNSNVWLRIRSNVLNLPVYKMKNVTGAVGAAILAASRTQFSNIVEATQALTQIEKKILPEKELVAQYNKYYLQFLDVLQEKGYIKKEKYA